MAAENIVTHYKKRSAEGHSDWIAMPYFDWFDFAKTDICAR